MDTIIKMKNLWSSEIYGSILQFVPPKNLFGNVINSHPVFNESILLHYPFQFKEPNDLYAFEISDIKVLIKNPHIDINMIFLYLCKKGEIELVKIILKNTLYPTIYIKYKLNLTKYSNYAISSAVRYGQKHILRILLADPRINLKNIATEYNLMFISKRYDLIKILISDSRIDLTADNDLIFRLVSRYGSFDLIKMLIDDVNIDPTSNSGEAIVSACKYGHTEIVKLLMSINETPRYPRHKRIDLSEAAFIGAIVNNNLNIIKLLINPINNHIPIDPSFGNNKAIRLASKLGHHSLVRYFISLGSEYGIDPTVCNNESLRMAVTRNHKQTVRELLKYPKVDPYINSGMLLRLAVKHNYVEIVEYLKNDERYIHYLIL